MKGPDYASAPGRCKLHLPASIRRRHERRPYVFFVGNANPDGNSNDEADCDSRRDGDGPKPPECRGCGRLIPGFGDHAMSNRLRIERVQFWLARHRIGFTKMLFQIHGLITRASSRLPLDKCHRTVTAFTPSIFAIAGIDVPSSSYITMIARRRGGSCSSARHTVVFAMSAAS